MSLYRPAKLLYTTLTGTSSRKVDEIAVGQYPFDAAVKRLYPPTALGQMETYLRNVGGMARRSLGKGADGTAVAMQE